MAILNLQLILENALGILMVLSNIRDEFLTASLETGVFGCIFE
jgi:hypothetical protein